MIDTVVWHGHCCYYAGITQHNNKANAKNITVSYINIAYFTWHIDYRVTPIWSFVDNVSSYNFNYLLWYAKVYQL